MAKTKSPPASTDDDRQLILDDIMGHGQVIGFLRRSLESDQLPQSLLFSGPAGIGKKTLAWALTREVIAQGEDARTHSGALKASRGNHPDVMVCDNGQTVSGQIRIEDIRRAEDWVATYPLESPRKILIIEPADRMNPSAANGLLKLLEEPPSHLLILLITSEPARLLPTIRSRCTPLVMEAIEKDELAKWLATKSNADEQRQRMAVELSEGRPGYALWLLQSNALSKRKELITELALLKTHGFAIVFRVAERVLSFDTDLSITLTLLLVLMRDATTLAMGIDSILNSDLKSEIEDLTNNMAPENMLEAASVLERAIPEATGFYHPQAKLQFVENLIINMGKQLRRR